VIGPEKIAPAFYNEHFGPILTIIMSSGEFRPFRRRSSPAWR
jgi:hypothetical protein